MKRRNGTQHLVVRGQAKRVRGGVRVLPRPFHPGPPPQGRLSQTTILGASARRLRHHCCVSLSPLPLPPSCVPLPPRTLDFILLLPLLPSSIRRSSLFPSSYSLCTYHARGTPLRQLLTRPFSLPLRSISRPCSCVFHLSRPPVVSGDCSQARRTPTSAVTVHADHVRRRGVVSVIAGHQGDTVDHHQRCVTAHLLRCVTPLLPPILLSLPLCFCFPEAFSAPSPAVSLFFFPSCLLHLHGVRGC